MSDEEKPDFSFLNESKSSSDSAILEKDVSESETEPAEGDTGAEKKEETQPAWMDEPETLEDRYDSSTRFAAALDSAEQAESTEKGLFNFSDEQEQDKQPVAQDQDTEPVAANENRETEEAASAEETERIPSDSDQSEPENSDEKPGEEEPVSTTQREEIAVSAAETEKDDRSRSAVKEKVVSAKVTSASSSQSSRGPVVSKRLFLIVLSYASAITLVCAILIMQSLQAKPHDLESLPDLKPPMKDDEIAYRLVPEAAKLPLGHSLKLGQSQRFGNLLVTPIKVVYEPLQFSHYSDDPTKIRPASKPVMKLWLKFENVSKDQKFAPLDRKLMLMRIVDPKNPEYMRSNQFLCPADSKGDLDKTSLLYNLEMVGDWDFAAVEDDPVLAPGESLEIYLPSSEDAYDKMEGKITWRVQFRKGYHPESKRGVTTLIEVVFDKSQVAST